MRFNDVLKLYYREVKPNFYKGNFPFLNLNLTFV
jgi:hypothetical protein